MKITKKIIKEHILKYNGAYIILVNYILPNSNKVYCNAVPLTLGEARHFSKQDVIDYAYMVLNDNTNGMTLYILGE